MLRPATLLTIVALLGACDGGGPDGTSAPAAERSAARAGYVGREACRRCHEPELARWEGSHHDLAMQEANEATVLGDFDGARFTHFGVTSEFFRRGDRFLVRTDGADGAPGEFEIAYAFGVYPLQQYLIPLEGGRLQALGIAWDTRPREEGGQRWFHLYPDEAIPHDDLLHWTGINQNWNHMCAECHSTRVRKGYSPAEDRYETTWFEIDVACEACHGPGRDHVAWAEAVESGEVHAEAGSDMGLALGRKPDRQWVFDAGGAIARRVPPSGSALELETCARCHARRAIISEDYVHGRPLMDTHRPALLTPGLYHADGQILDEVYVYGSFLQSRMAAAGVTCSDCHDPHSLALGAGPDGSCARCHRPEVFAAPEHHHHLPDSTGASCVACHMAARVYMGVDARHDHSFRVPRPDLSTKLGTPNACTDCHSDRPAAWAADACRAWYGGKRAETPHYGEALHAGRTGALGADQALAALARDPGRPAIVRATALELLGAASPDALRAGLSDPDPLVRAAALGGIEGLDPAAQAALGKPLLRDPVRLVRTEAARILAAVPSPPWKPAERRALAEALAEYRAAQQLNADRPEGHLNSGLLHARLGQVEEARGEYERALRLAPWFVPAWVNAADLERQAGREDEAERILRRALAVSPGSADLHHALGLSLVRRRRPTDAVEALRRASQLAPDSARYAYVYGVALHSVGRTDAAIETLARARARFPADRDILLALVAIHRDRGDLDRAADYARRITELGPEDPSRPPPAEPFGGGTP